MVCVSRHKHLAPMSQLFISSSRPKIWTQFKDAYKAQFKHFQRVALEHFYLCIEASLAGLGATVVSAYMVEKELDFQMLDMLTRLCKMALLIIYFPHLLLRMIRIKSFLKIG